VFALLPKIKIGDEIFITDQNGNQFVYKVTQTIVVSPKDLNVLEQGSRDERILTLQTSYPLGTALKRFIVQAEME
jgi:LPXTG-site transpeptidase (sortase) family protein